MSGRRKKRRPAIRDMFASGARKKGIELTIRVDTELVHLLDAYRSEVQTATGCVLDRRTVFEGLVRKVWKDKLEEAMVLGIGSKVSREDD